MPESSRPYEKLSDEAKQRVLASVKRSIERGTIVPAEPEIHEEPNEEEQDLNDESGDGYTWPDAS